MRLVLTNGYPYPFPAGLTDDEAEALSAAAAGVRLELGEVVAFEWLHTVTVEFASLAATEAAQEVTGWGDWSAFVLEADVSDADGYAHPAIVANGKAYCGFQLLP
jgi:hypothetical protein